MDRVTIQWTDEAKDGLRKLPPKVRRGILDKANELREADDPQAVHKPLKGPLAGYYRICYARYRAIYSVEVEEIVSGDCIIHIKIHFVAVGMRKEGDKKDIYRIAQKLFDMGILKSPADADEPEDQVDENPE